MSDGRTLLESHVVSYVPSGSVLAVLRSAARPPQSQGVLAVSASPSGGATVIPSAKAITRAAYDLDSSQLRSLPSANDEARSVDVAEGLRDAKLQMLKSFGPQAVPRLWSGVLVYGDGRSAVVPRRDTTASRE